MTQNGGTIKYRAEIDGLRTLAVIPVVLFHLDYQFIKGGYYGVDVFFVISGYLITKILIDKIKEGKFSMYDFWIRRIKRLLPMVITVVFATILCAFLLSIYKPMIRDIAKDSFPAMFSYFNFYALYNFGDYWGGDAKNSFFLHTWSLSVEEQFYLIYPFFLFLCHRFFKSFLIPLIVLTVASFVFFAYYLGVNKEFTFYMLPTRIWELSIGGLANLLVLNSSLRKNIFAQILPLLGLLMIAVGYFFGSEIIDMMVILPVLGTVLVILFSNGKDIVGKILSQGVFTFIGKLSYSMYLWHWVVILMFRNVPELWAIYSRILIVVITVALSYLSYTFIENRSRNYKYTPKIVLACVLAISGLCFYLKSDYFDVKYQSNFTINQKAEIIEHHSEKNKNALKENGIYTLVDGKSPEIMVLGDSHAVALANVINDISDDLQLSRSFYCRIGLRANININDIENQTAFPLDKDLTKEEKVEYAKAIMKALDNKNLKLVIISMRWDLRDISKFEELFRYITKDKKVKLLIVNQVPMINYGLVKIGENIEQKLTYLGYEADKNKQTYVNYNGESVADNNKKVSEFSKKFDNAYIFDIYSNLTKDQQMLLINKGEVFYKDTNHISEFGAHYIEPELKKTIVEVLEFPLK